MNASNEVRALIKAQRLLSQSRARARFAMEHAQRAIRAARSSELLSDQASEMIKAVLFPKLKGLDI
jgi:hypothetical protein